MLPRSLYSVWREFKQDTDSLASWLASTAKMYGYSGEGLSAAADKTAQPSVRLKGKARKEAKKAAPVVQPNTQPKHIIGISQFVPLAEFIASKKDIPVPDSFFQTIDRIIAIRSNFGAQLGKYGTELELRPQDFQSHRFFVLIFQKVRKTLSPMMSAPTADGSSAVTKPASEFENGFDPMKVYEPSPDSLNGPDIERPQKAADCNDDTEYEAEQITSIADAMIAWAMLMNDLCSIRSRVQWIWMGFRDGSVDVAAAAVATNSAVDLARTLIEEVTPLFKDFEGTYGIVNKFFMYIGLMRGFTQEQIKAFSSDDFDLYDVATEVYVIAYSLWETMIENPPHNKQDFAMWRDNMTFGVYEPGGPGDWERMPNDLRFRNDMALLSEFFTEVMTVIRMVPNYPVQDELIRGVKEADKVKDEIRHLPFYVVFAAQLFLDINHLLGTQTVLGFEQLGAQLVAIDDNIKRHLKFHDTIKTDNWPPSLDRALTDMRNDIKTIRADPIYSTKKKVYADNHVAFPESMTPNRILQRSPVLAGLMLFRFRAEMHEVGVAVVRAWGSIQCSAHLYNALRQEGLVKEEWRDMDVAMKLLGETSSWPWGRPRTAEEYFKKFCLQIGVSAAAFSDPKKRRKNAAVASRTGLRPVAAGTAPVSKMFDVRYRRDVGQKFDLTPQHVDEILTRGRLVESGSEENGTLILENLEIKDAAKRNDKPTKTTTNATNEKAVQGGLSSGERTALLPDQLIRSLVVSLQNEVLEFSFPYMALHRHCWKLLRKVKENCDGVLRELYTPAYLERESELPWVVGYILMASSGLDRGMQDRRLMESAATTLGEFLNGGGGEKVWDVLKDVRLRTMYLESAGLQVGDGSHVKTKLLESADGVSNGDADNQPAVLCPA